MTVSVLVRTIVKERWDMIRGIDGCGVCLVRGDDRRVGTRDSFVSLQRWDGALSLSKFADARDWRVWSRLHEFRELQSVGGRE